jgi:hypothetical protein
MIAVKLTELLVEPVLVRTLRVSGLAVGGFGAATLGV